MSTFSWVVNVVSKHTSASDDSKFTEGQVCTQARGHGAPTPSTVENKGRNFH